MPSSLLPYAELRERYRFLPKDFVETRLGILCAVVALGVEEKRVLVTPRYHRDESGKLTKLTTADAMERIRRLVPRWMFYSSARDVEMPAIPVDEITQVFRPAERWQSLLLGEGENAAVFHELARVLAPIAGHIGITGSHLVAAARAESDIDLIIYGRDHFAVAQGLVEQAIRREPQPVPTPFICDSPHWSELSESQWRVTFERRGCRDLTFEEYLWHEKRKGNKCSIGDVRIDLSCVDAPHPIAGHAICKRGIDSIRGRVTDDSYAFATPAVWKIAHSSVRYVVANTATYVGQARVGEWIEACGYIEEDALGDRRLTVGSSRESRGEYIKVVGDVHARHVNRPDR